MSAFSNWLCFTFIFVLVPNVVLSQNLKWPGHGLLLVGNTPTISPPSVAILHDTAYLAFQGEDNGIYLAASVDGVNWMNTAQRIFPQDTTSVAPVLCTFKGIMYFVMKAQTTDELFIAWTADGQNWNAAHPSKFLPNDPQTPGSPSMAVFQGRMYILFQGENKGLYLSSTADGHTWTNVNRIFPSDTTGVEPTLGVFQGKLFMVMKAETTNEMFLAWTADGNTWNATHPSKFIPNDPLSPVPSTLTVADCFLYFFWQGENKGLYLSSSTDGATWRAPTRILPNDTTNGKLTLYAWKGNLNLIWHSQTTNQMFIATAATSTY